MFNTLVEFKQWIKDFSVKYHRSYTVLHSDVKKRYTVKYKEDGCPWNFVASRAVEYILGAIEARESNVARERSRRERNKRNVPATSAGIRSTTRPNSIDTDASASRVGPVRRN
jgi:hypothetical protein